MRRLAIAVALLVLGVSMSRTAVAVTFNDPIGDIYLSFDNTLGPNKGTAGRYKTVDAFAPFNFYVMVNINWGDAPYNDPGRNASDGLKGWEASVVLPAGMIISGARTMGGANWFDAGSGDDNWVVGTAGVCVTGSQSPFTLVTYSGALLLAAANDLRVTIGASTPSSFDDTGCIICTPQPGILGCDPSGGNLYPTKQRWPGGWITVNCTANCDVAASSESWGSLKAGFDNR
jgi:hypothetical protein